MAISPMRSSSPTARAVDHRPIPGVVGAALIALVSAAQADPDAANPREAAAPPAIETIALFDADRFETPEGIAIDSRGNRYISLALTGEIRKITPEGSQSGFAVLSLGAPPLTPCGPFIGIMGALAMDSYDNLYATLASCDPASRGIWKISPAGQTTLLAALPMDALPNGIAFRRAQLYVADSNLGLIWRIPAEGGSATVWLDHPLLKRPRGEFPGPNGVQFFRHELYVANSDAGTILAVEFKADGSAGDVRVHASDTPCDDFAFDVLGNAYCTTDPFNTVLRIAPDGSSEVLLSAADGLDGPTATLFGRHGGDRLDIYITNAAFPFFSTVHRPSLLRVTLGISGSRRVWKEHGAPDSRLIER